LSGAHNNSTTTINVTDGSVFPSVGNFRLLIDSEIMKATARSVNAITVVRGTEGTAAASHTDQATVTAVISAAALPELFARHATYVRRSALDDADFTAVNLGSSTVTTQDGIISFATPESSVNVRRLMKALPSAPYTLTLTCWYNQPVTSVNAGGLCLDDGTKIITIALLGSGQIELQKWNSQTSFNALYSNAVTNNNWPRYGKPIFLRFADDNAGNRTLWISQDGISFEQLLTVGSADFLTPTRYGLFINSEGAAGTRILTAYDLQVS
jgi:hypothetical protein